ncbi:MAG: hypothetical protein HY815_07305 [Candidatus Riflebacteria bacterium]|nr:hypothetical protein [Candidatus Riflebacteria bacterium]
MRCRLWVTSIVWRVANTRWPVSAAEIATRMVSRSRISPITMMSGLCLTTWRSAVRNDSVSVETSLWLTRDLRSRWTNSIGSSIVTMWAFRVLLM